MILAALVACGGGGPDTPAECNPQGTTGCVLPWPSMRYLRADDTSPTGYRMNLPVGALPVNFDGIEIDTARINQRTGFSPMSQILLTGIDPAGLPDFEDSTSDASPTRIVNLSTGERVAHFAEIDVNEVDKPEERVVYLRPAVRLDGNTRYAVTVKDVKFEFVTADDASLIADPLAARDAAMAALGDIAYAIKSDTPNPEPGIARIVRFEYTTPRIADERGFRRDASGKVIADGTTMAPASIVIPSCATAQNKAGIVIYGHGFFGGLDESTGGYVRAFAKDTCSVVVGGLWRGMSADEVADAVLALNDLNRMHAFGERIWQGMVDFMTLTKLAKGKLAADLGVVDPNRIWFYGISQGHILGSTFFAYDPTLTRGVLGVGGANWGIMFERSNNWAAYSLPLKGSYGGVMNSVILQQVIEMGLELVDGATIAPMLRAGGLPGTPPKQYLMQMSVGDCAVPNLASEYQARTLGLPLVGPSVKTPFGFTPSAGPHASGFAIYDEKPTPLPPSTNETFNYDNVAHENLRRRRAAIDQIVQFVTTGEIVNRCTGVCDCAAGNCGPLL